MKSARTRFLGSILFLAVFAGAAITLLSVDEAGSSPLEDSMARKRGPEAVAAAKAQEKADEGPAVHDPVTGAAHEGASEAPPIAAIREKGAPGCLADQAAFEDMRKRREELDAHAKELAAKDLELKAREQALDEQLKKLEQVRDEIAKIEGGYRKENQEKVAKLVETFENMSPKSTAQLLTNIDDGLAVAAMSQMSTVKLSKVMNIMEPERASKLTELLAGVTRAKTLAHHKARASTSPNNPSVASQDEPVQSRKMDVAAVTGTPSGPVAAPESPSAKGGETENGHKNEQSKQPVSNTPDGPSQREPASQKGKGSN